MTDYETVIGLECHIELSTRTKMFCGCSVSFGDAPNTHVCEICLGHPGTLPVPNEKAIEYIVRIGLALGCEIAPRSVFARKNYFYPDMPKNYQISQFDLPTCINGNLAIEIDGTEHTIGITRVHMEEDTGKTTHAGATGRIHDADYALVDFNRAGVPLVECVSEPDMRSPEEARAYLTALRDTLQALDVSDVRMEEGSLRCDGNISVRPVGTAELGTKVEIKNMNSIRSLENALKYERERQIAAIKAGQTLVQETRHWNEDEQKTTSMRSKEEAFDYRYFPEPDIPPLEPERVWVGQIQASLPELPAARRERFEREHGLKPELAFAVASSRDTAAFFEEAVKLGAPAVTAANWMTQDVAAYLNETKADLAETKLTPRHLADLVKSVDDGTISASGGKQVLAEVLSTGDPIAAVIGAKGLKQVSDTDELGIIANEVIAENPGPVEQFRGGKEGVIGFLVGQVMKKTGGSANPKVVQEVLRERLGLNP